MAESYAYFQVSHKVLAFLNLTFIDDNQLPFHHSELSTMCLWPSNTNWTRRSWITCRICCSATSIKRMQLLDVWKSLSKRVLAWERIDVPWKREERTSWRSSRSSIPSGPWLGMAPKRWDPVQGGLGALLLILRAVTIAVLEVSLWTRLTTMYISNLQFQTFERLNLEAEWLCHSGRNL